MVDRRRGRKGERRRPTGGREHRVSGGERTNGTVTELEPRNITAERSTSAAPLTLKPG